MGVRDHTIDVGERIRYDLKYSSLIKCCLNETEFLEYYTFFILL